jgi:hypothetical protein
MSDLFKIVTKDLILNWLIITLIFALHYFCAEIYDNYSEVNFSIRKAFWDSFLIFLCYSFIFYLGPIVMWLVTYLLTLVLTKLNVIPLHKLTIPLSIVQNLDTICIVCFFFICIISPLDRSWVEFFEDFLDMSNRDTLMLFVIIFKLFMIKPRYEKIKRLCECD